MKRVHFQARSYDRKLVVIAICSTHFTSEDPDDARAPVTSEDASSVTCTRCLTILADDVDRVLNRDDRMHYGSPMAPRCGAPGRVGAAATIVLHLVTCQGCLNALAEDGTLPQNL